jgi:hypothetical protein
MFINVIYDPNNTIPEYFSENYVLINFNNYIDKNKIYSQDLFYKIIEFDWKIIYNLIKLNLPDKYKNNFKYYE